MLERLSWKRLALELLLCCLPAVILGLIFGYLPWFLLAAVTGLLIWHFWNLLRLSWWLWVDRSMTPPPGRGSWEPLLYGLNQMQLRNKKRRRELGNLIKRFRSGAESLPDAVVLMSSPFHRVGRVKLPLKLTPYCRAVSKLQAMTFGNMGNGSEACDTPQCATAAAAASSISLPVVKRSSVKGAFSGCGSSLAIVQARRWPAPGVALKPPVPQPQLT